MPARRRLTTITLHNVGVVIAAALLFLFTHRSLGAWVMDDAGITYAYSIALADHGSLSPLPESMPVEGYSNPLLFLLVALLRALHLFDPITTHANLECSLFAGLSLCVFQILRHRVGLRLAWLGTALFVALELLTPSTWLWYHSGLENLTVSLALVGLFLLIDRRMREGTCNALVYGGVAMLAALTRPEAPVYVAAFYVALVTFGKPAALGQRANWIAVGRAASVTTLLFATFLLWRHSVYGEWLPNTYFAKLGSGSHVASNIHMYVVRTIFPYAGSIGFALTAALLGTIALYRRAAAVLALMMLASLAMPIIAGRDWMGEHRFVTAFFVMTHLTAVMAVTAVLATWPDTARRRRNIYAGLVAAPFVFLGARGPLALSPPAHSEVTIQFIARLHGALRIDHQRRLGLINPVVATPDAGGTMLYGALQLLDIGFLTDYQMSHMARTTANVTQYVEFERNADLGEGRAIWPFNVPLLGAPRYVAHRDAHMLARRDLVTVAQAPNGTTPFYEHDGVRLYLSNETVPFAGPHGLVRVEVIVTWCGAASPDNWVLQGTIGNADADAISLLPYDTSSESVANCAQRRALLLSAPAGVGMYDLTFNVRQGDSNLFHNAVAKIEVLDVEQLPRAVSTILTAPTIDIATQLRRFAWLREQWLARLGPAQFAAAVAALERANRERSDAAASVLATLQWDARLADFEPTLPAALRDAKKRLVETFMQAPLATSGDAGRDTERTSAGAERGPAQQTLIIGRRVDVLRRFGYFGVLQLVPSTRKKLAELESQLEQLTDQDRYTALLGLTLAMPQRVGLQRHLVRARDAQHNSGFSRVQ